MANFVGGGVAMDGTCCRGRWVTHFVGGNGRQILSGSTRGKFVGGDGWLVKTTWGSSGHDVGDGLGWGGLGQSCKTTNTCTYQHVPTHAVA